LPRVNSRSFEDWIIDWREENGSRLVSSNPPDLRWKFLVVLDLQGHEVANAKRVFNLEPAAAA
jgi:hypothetical protein